LVLSDPERGERRVNQSPIPAATAAATLPSPIK
jgi:hypothetical protein